MPWILFSTGRSVLAVWRYIQRYTRESKVKVAALLSDTFKMMLRKVILVRIGYSPNCIFECFTAFTSTDLIKQNNQTNSEIFFCFTLSVLVRADPKGMLIQLNSLITYQGMAVYCPTLYRQGLHSNCRIVKFSEDPFPKNIHKFMLRKTHTFAKRSPLTSPHSLPFRLR